MDDSDDSCWSWPYWKFGLKRDDLAGALHEQYNTVPTPILDPEAFHHDVYEISQQAGSTAEFHHLLHDRKQQRLRELNETLESASFEIIANPALIGTDQWQHAIQLFRSRSLDSLVRYFASYLPSDHPWYKSSATSSEADSSSSVPALTDSHSTLFDGEYEGGDEHLIMTEEPFEYPSYPKQLLPPSPRSMTMCSDSSVASPIGDDDDDDAHHDFDFTGPATPARTLSFSESEPDCCAMPDAAHARCGCELVSRCADDFRTTVATVAHTDEPTIADDGVDNQGAHTKQQQPSSSRDNDQHGAATLPLTLSPTNEITDFETPTPKPETQSAAFFDDAKDTKPSPAHQRYRSLSPSRPAHPLSERDLDQVLTAHRDPRNPQRSRFMMRRECSPVVQRHRRSPVEPATRIQKHAVPVEGGARARPRSRRCAVDS